MKHIRVLVGLPVALFALLGGKGHAQSVPARGTLPGLLFPGSSLSGIHQRVTGTNNGLAYVIESVRAYCPTASCTPGDPGYAAIEYDPSAPEAYVAGAGAIGPVMQSRTVGSTQIASGPVDYVSAQCTHFYTVGGNRYYDELVADLQNSNDPFGPGGTELDGTITGTGSVAGQDLTIDSTRAASALGDRVSPEIPQRIVRFQVGPDNTNSSITDISGSISGSQITNNSQYYAEEDNGISGILAGGMTMAMRGTIKTYETTGPDAEEGPVLVGAHEGGMTCSTVQPRTGSTIIAYGYGEVEYFQARRRRARAGSSGAPGSFRFGNATRSLRVHRVNR